MSNREKDFESYEFDNFRLEIAPRRLVGQDGKVIPLSPKTFDILLLLVENSGELLTKDELINRIWADHIVEENNLTVRIASLRKVLGEARGENLFIQTVPGHGYRFVAKVTTGGAESNVASQAEKPESALVVLPFVNESSDADLDYLCDGVTETIINNLSQLRQIKVISRTSAFRYKKSELPLSLIGRQLRAGFALLGRIYKMLDQLCLSVELVKTADESQIWGARYKYELADIFELQDSIAGEVTTKLSLNLSKSDKSLLSKRHTQNTEAYLLYLKGRYFWNRRGLKDTEKAIEYFEKAIEADTNYAPAYAGLADCCCLLSAYGFLPLKDIVQRAETAAVQALELNEMLAEPHTSLAYIKMNFYRDWAAAEKEFKRALQLNPNYTQAYHWFAHYLANMGRFDEAVFQLQKARQIDPLALPLMQSLAKTLYLARRYEEAILKCFEILEINPKYGPASGMLGLIYIEKKMYEEALREINKLIEFTAKDYRPAKNAKEKPPQQEMIFSESDPEATAIAGYIYTLMGEKRQAAKVLEWLENLAKVRYVEPHTIALLHMVLGNKKKAFELLEKSLADSSPVLTYFKVIPLMDPFRADRRFDDILRRIGF